MGFQNNWAISPTTNTAYYRASAASSGTTTYTLLNTVAAPGGTGVGYKLSSTADGADSGKTFTLIGHAMGTPAGTLTTEVITGPATTTVYSTNYYDRITSVTPSGSMAGNISVGVLGTSCTLPLTRVKGVYYVGTGSAGSIKINMNSTTGRLVVQVDTPASATVANHVTIYDGLLLSGGALTDFGLVTLTNVTFCTIFCG